MLEQSGFGRDFHLLAHFAAFFGVAVDESDGGLAERLLGGAGENLHKVPDGRARFRSIRKQNQYVCFDAQQFL